MRKPEQPFLFLDTNILIWGVLQSGDTPKEQEMVKKATAYLDKAAKDGMTMAISMVTVGEFLACVPQDEHEKYIALLQKGFAILPYDLAAAKMAAVIFSENFSKMKSSYKGQRGLLRQDIQILASALAHGNISVIVTEDKGFQDMAKRYLTVNTLPEPPMTQMELFDQPS